MFLNGILIWYVRLANSVVAGTLIRLHNVITLAISKCYGKVRVLFFRATTL